MEPSRARLRAGLLLLGLVLGWLPTLWLVVPAITAEADTLDEHISVALGWALLVGWTWWCTALGPVAAEVLLTGRATRTAARAPRAARALVAAACGVGALGVLAGPVAADPVDGFPRLHLLDGLALPDRPLGMSSKPRPPTDVRPHAVIVRAGDTLSDLAAGLGVSWTDLYAANRAVVGSDPDLILPGQHLVIPVPAPPSHTHHEGAPR